MSAKRLQFLICVIFGTILLGLTLGCFGSKAPTLPSAPVIVATTDADVRAAIAKAYDILDASVDLIIKVRRLEEKLLLPASVHQTIHAETGSALIDIRQLVKEIDTKVVNGWAQFQNRLDPIVKRLQALLTIAETKGTSFWDILSAGINLVLPLLVPGIPHTLEVSR